MSCQWQMGMLTMRPCGAPAMSGCGLCGRQICMAHTVMGQSGPACPQCASTHEGYEETEDTDMASSRDEYYRPYGGTSEFGRQGFFSPTDSAAMSQRPGFAPQQRPQSTDDYDSMET